MTPPRTNTLSPPFTGGPRPREAMDPDVPARYIHENFRPGDRLAVVLIQKQTNRVVQRIASADRIAQPEFQSWLRHANASRHEIYIGMNSVKPGSRSRTKGDIAEIRHVYLDFDDNGTAAVQSLIRRDDLPKPNYLVSTSPDRWQVVWKVEGFQIEEAERLMRHLVRETGADPAATDASRVLRLPGFISHKHGRPFLVRVEPGAVEVYGPEHFPRYATEEPKEGMAERPSKDVLSFRTGRLSQSELDWAYAKRALSRGEEPQKIEAAIARYRAGEKSNPAAYAARTVSKAIQALDNQRESTARRPGR